MYEQVEKPKESKSRAVANSVSQKQSSSAPTFHIEDNREDVVAQRQLQGLIQTPQQTDAQLQGATVQLVMDYKGYKSFDSWVTWGNSWKPGAEQKWNHLVDLRQKAKAIINADLDSYPEQTITNLNNIYRSIGFSEYETVRDILIDAHKQIDTINLKRAGKHAKSFKQELNKYFGNSSPFTKNKNVIIKGDDLFKKVTTALLFKMYTTTTGSEIGDKILSIVNEKKEKFPIVFKPGDESLAAYSPKEAIISLNIFTEDYASGEHGEAIANDLEIVLVHELGHVLKNLDGDRGDLTERYKSLGHEDRRMWSDEEEYSNINLVENRVRKDRGIPERKYHAGDPLIFKEEQNLLWIYKNSEEVNISIIHKVLAGDRSYLLTVGEIVDFATMRILMKLDDNRTQKNTVDLRALIRKHLAKIRLLRAMPGPGGREYNVWLKQEQQYIHEHGAIVNNLMPAGGW